VAWLTLSHMTLKHAEGGLPVPAVTPKSYQAKIITMGNMAELYVFKDPVVYNHASKNGRGSAVVLGDACDVDGGGDGGVNGIDRETYKADTSWIRARQRVRRLINANPGLNKFLTLTFAENVKDVDEANYVFKKFKQKLARKISPYPLKYIGVIEFQQRGAVHYHLMLDIPYIPAVELSALWGFGYIEITRIQKRNRAGAYMAKTFGEITKKVQKDDPRLFGKKLYFYSRGLLDKPKIFVDNQMVEFERQVDSFPHVLSQSNFYVLGRGRVSYMLLTNDAK